MYTKEYYEEKAAKAIDGMYGGSDSDSRQMFNLKLGFYENRIRHLEMMEIMNCPCANQSSEPEEDTEVIF